MSALSAWVEVEVGSPMWEVWMTSNGDAARAASAETTASQPVRLSDHRGRIGTAQRAMARLVGDEVFHEDLSDAAWWDLVMRAEAELSPDEARDINGFGEVAREADYFLRRMRAGLSDRVWELISV